MGSWKLTVYPLWFQFKSMKLCPFPITILFVSFSSLLEDVARHPEKPDWKSSGRCFNTSSLPSLESGSRSKMWQSVAEKEGRSGVMLAKLTLSVKILLCRVSHIFPPLAAGLVVVRLVARMAFATGEVGLLPVMATLLVRTRHPGLGGRGQNI